PSLFSTLSLHDALPISLLPIFIDILKQFITWQIAQPAYDLGEVGIFYADGVLYAALTPKVKVDSCTSYIHVVIAKSGQPKRIILDRKSTRLNSSHRTIS